MEEKQITLQIDGHFITVPEGSTILEAACKIGINIPTLCHIDLKGTCIKNNPASCRICVVEVAGRRNLAPACATRCTEGMVVKTSTLRVMNARKVVAELILSDHPNDCLTCPKCGNCELQTLALRFNIREIAFDRWGAVQMSQNLEGLGFTMVQFGQGYKDMSPPTKELMKLTLEQTLAHNGHPVLRWMMDNIFIRRDPAGNIKPDKEKSTEKIDGAVAMIMALDRAIRCGCVSDESVYDSREMLIL